MVKKFCQQCVKNKKKHFMKILITGGAGFIGSELAEYLSQYISLKKNLLIVDNLSNNNLDRIKHLKNKITFIKHDVKKIGQKSLKGVDWIIHASAIAPLPDNQVSHYMSLQENVSQCGAIVDCCIRDGVKNILFLSSSAIYETTKGILHENSVKQPILMYPLSKYLSEKYFESITKSYDLNVVCLRLANVYGRNQSYNRKQPPLHGYLIKNILFNKKSTLYARGNFKRDYIFIDDLSNLINKIICSKKFINKKRIFEQINVGSGKSYSVLDFLKIYKKIFHKEVLVKWGNKKEYWNKYKKLYNSKIYFDSSLIKKEVEKKVKLDLKKIKKLYNWKTEFAIDEGLRECINYAKKKLIK